MDNEAKSEPVAPPRKKLTKLKSECCDEESVKKVVRPITIFTSNPDSSSQSKKSLNDSKKAAPKRPPFPSKSISLDTPHMDIPSQTKNEIKSIPEEKPIEQPKPLPRPISSNRPVPSPRKSTLNNLANLPLDESQKTTKAVYVKTNDSELYLQQSDNSVNANNVIHFQQSDNNCISTECFQQNKDYLNVIQSNITTEDVQQFMQHTSNITTEDSQKLQQICNFGNTLLSDTSNLRHLEGSSNTTDSQKCYRNYITFTDTTSLQGSLQQINDSTDTTNLQKINAYTDTTILKQHLHLSNDSRDTTNLLQTNDSVDVFQDSFQKSIDSIDSRVKIDSINMSQCFNTKKDVYKKGLGLKSRARISETELHNIHAKLTLDTKNIYKSLKANSKCFSQYDLMVYAFYDNLKKSKSLENISTNAVVHKPYYENCVFNEFLPKCKSYKQQHTSPYENIDINKTKSLDDQDFSDYQNIIKDHVSLFPSESSNDYSEIKMSPIKSKQFRPAASIPYLGLRLNMKQGFHKDFEKIENIEEDSLYDSPRVIAGDYVNLESSNFKQKYDLVTNDSILLNSELQLIERHSEAQKPMLQSRLEPNTNQALLTKERLSSTSSIKSSDIYPITDGFQVYDSPKSLTSNYVYEPLVNDKISTKNNYEKLDIKTKDYDFVPQRPPPPYRNSRSQSICQESPSANCLSDGTSPKKQEPPRPPPPRLLTDSKNEISHVSSPVLSSGINPSKSTSMKSDENYSSDSQSDNEAKYEKPPGRKLFLIAQEILTTERSFVNALKLICEEFKEKVHVTLAKNNKFLPEGAFQAIFMNVEQIYELDKKFLKELEERMEKWEHHNRIGDIIRSYSYFLKMYVTYIKGYDNAMLVLHDCLSTNLKFAHFVAEFEEKNMRISSYFLRPIQRIPSYRLLLKEYLKNLTKDSVDFKDITDGVEIVSEIANHINESMKEGEKFQEVLRIQSMIVNHKDLIKPGRFLVKEGTLQKMSRKELQQRIFILFTDTLLYCSSVGQTQLKLIHDLPLTEMVVQYPEFEDMTSEFSIVSKKRSFYLKASSTKERDEWVKTLQQGIEIAQRKMGSFRKEPPVMVMDLGDVAPPWIPDSRVTMCQTCTQAFNIYKRRHHCRACGKVVCSDCSSYEAPLRFMDYEALRVCEDCYTKLLTRFNEIHFENKNEEIHAKFKQKTKKPKVDRKKLLPSTLTEIDAHEEGIQNSGFLKLVRKGQKDKRCWFVLKDHVLYKYKASSDPAAKTTTPILGYGVEILGNWEEDFMFALTHAGLKEPLVYKAENKTSAERWLHCLTKATALNQS